MIRNENINCIKHFMVQKLKLQHASQLVWKQHIWNIQNFLHLFLVNESPCSSKKVQENVVLMVILCCLWRYKVKFFVSLCTKSNRLWKEICWNKLRSAIFSDFSLWQYNYTWEHYHLFLEDCEWLRILKKFALDINQKIGVKIRLKIQ